MTWPMLFTIAGALVYAFVPGKAARLGEIAFFVGLFWLVYAMSHTTLRL